MNINRKKILIVSALIISFLMIPFLNNININQNVNDFDGENKKNDELLKENLNTQGLSIDNVFSGIGAPWNVTHYANGTKTNLAVSFNNNSYDASQQLELYGWNGYQFNSTITNLYDTRNWINGTFHRGSFTGGSPPGSNDSQYIANWTFKSGEIGGDNPVRGNYYDTSSSVSDGHDCLELGIDADSGDSYDVGDKCWWETAIETDRGDVDEAWLIFSIRAYSADAYNNHMVLQVIVNNKIIWGTGLASILEQSGNPSVGNWGDWYTPYPLYIDGKDGDIFPDGFKNMNITLEFKRVSGTASPYGDHSILFDNVSLIVKAKAKPSHLGLQLNNQDVIDTANYGEGYCGMLGNWNGSVISSVEANFSTDYYWPLTFEEDGIERSYEIELETNLTLYVNKSTPESYYTADPNDIYQGSAFTVANNSDVNWITYAHMEIPTGYEETNMTLEFPSDYNLLRVFFSQNPVSLDDINIKEYGNKKVVNIPVSSITSNTNLFWKLEAESPNYCTEMGIYNNATYNWLPSNEFFSGQWINITANISNSQLISGYINKTKAQLQIKFPNGTIWAEESQFKQVNNPGMVYFDPILIPSDGSNYKVGEYHAIVTWNNSYSNFNFNETGIIYKSFTVIHNSTLVALDDYYEDAIYGEEINLEVTFKDLKNDKPIEGANITLTNFTGGIQTFEDLDNGYYLLIFNTSGGDPGENNLTIYATHPLYNDNQVNITIEVIFYTDLTAEEYPSIEVPWNNNFTIHLNYTFTNGTGIDGANSTVTWNDDWSIKSGNGLYNITCNTSKYQVNTAPNLRIDFDEIGYESQTKIISIEVVERETSLAEIIIDNRDCTTNQTANIHSGDLANITVKYLDNDAGGSLIHNAMVTLNGTDIGEVFTDNANFYNLTLNSTKLGVGIFFLNIIAQKDNYTAVTELLRINVYERKTDYWVYLNGVVQGQNPSIVLYKNQFLNITFTYNDTLLKEHIPGAIVDINGSGISELLPEAFNNYSVLINTNDLNQGVNFLTIFARKNGYEVHSVLIIVEIIQIETDLLLFVDGVDITSDPSINRYPDQILNITVSYNSSIAKDYIPGATVDINGSGISELLPEAFNNYSVLLNTNDLNQGANFLTIFARKGGYEPQTALLIIQIIQKETVMQIYLNGYNKTLDPVFMLTIGQSLNLTVKYTDQSGAYISNATVSLIGEGFSLDLVKDNTFDQYFTILNSADLGIGLKLFSIIAQKPDFESLTKDLRITINRIAVKISTVSREAQIEAEIGDDVLLQLFLNDTFFGEDIINATVTYNWAYGQGELEDSDNDGIFEILLENVREGIHTITINAFAGDNYDFQSYVITLVVTAPTVSPGPDLSWLVYVLVGAIAGLTIVFTLYQTHFKYPPMVRKIRKLKKNVKKAKKTKPILVNKRDELIETSIQNQKSILEFEPIQPNKKGLIDKIQLNKEGT
ncbi:MAG: hypothetical protein CEE43_01155 [Promethearchaeota archaeon Loki_b32]|nr:MAG: hypothetical protein CEE43_01155 [Candidatus Lokiarchaeota archaeon Loki_b32]